MISFDFKTTRLVSFRQMAACLLVVGLVLATWILCQSTVTEQATEQVTENYTKFLGEKWWTAAQLELCDDASKDTLWQKSESVCLTYLHNLLPVDMEIVKWSPALVIYRNLISARQVSDFLKLIETREMAYQETYENGKPQLTTYRRANGTAIDPGEAGVASEVHRKVQRLIPAFNFTNAELFSALSYLPGGHYSVHSDYLIYPSEEQYDWWMKTMRNRIGTLIFGLEVAAQGGGTVFPILGTTIRINPGDAFFWFSARDDESEEHLTNHGGCPIYEGRKVIVTLWIRAKDQPILATPPTGASINAWQLIPSLSKELL